MRAFVGALIAGGILFLLPGFHNPITAVVLGLLAVALMRQLGPRSMVEKTGAAVTAGLIAWVAGARTAGFDGLLAHLAGWTAAGGALAYYLHPKSE